MITKKNYQKCLKHISNEWQKLTFNLPQDQDIHIGLPNAFVAPTDKHGVFANDQYYWDSYFIILGLIADKKISLAKGMVDNFAFLQQKFNIIPKRNRYFNLGVSQPPFLSSMVLEVYQADNDKEWLKKLAKVIEEELLNYWIDDKRAEKHLVYQGLSRYCDHHINHITAEHESGQDMTSRFNDHCLDYLPIDLNCLLYKYETDLVKIFKILKQANKVKKYQRAARQRKKTINQLMWNKTKGFFFDYNYQQQKQSKFYSLAGFYPLWVGLANQKQAKKCLKKIKKFEYQYGLANTQTKVSKEFRQWDYPNGWANQHWIVIQGLLNYDFKTDAQRLATKWLNLNKKIFEQTNTFWEKYNVVAGQVGKQGRYPNQAGFAWTNAIFVKLIDEFSK